jgi:hypothetical protein
MSRYSVSRNRGKSLHWNSYTTSTMPTTSATHPNPTSAIPPPPPPLAYEIHQPPPPQFGTTDPKSSLADHLQLVSWPPHYRAAPPHKYHGSTDPHKILMCYKATITSNGSDEATLVKSLIISIEDTAINWYLRLPLKCKYS